MNVLSSLFVRILKAFLVVLIALSGHALAQDERLTIDFKVNHRNPSGYWNASIRSGEAVLDQMVINKGPDDTLREFRWDQLRETAAFAAFDIEKGNELAFRDKLRSLGRSMYLLATREAELKALRNEIKRELDRETERWNELLGGTSTEEYIGRALGLKGVGIAASAILQHYGSKLASDVANKMVVGSGKALGPVSTVISGLQVYLAAYELGEMKVLLPRLLEMTEMVAYLDVLLKRYDGVISGYEDTIDELWIAHRESGNRYCRDAGDSPR